MPKVEIDFGNIENTCFVIMPFNSIFEAEYNNIIRPAVEATGLKCIRADEIYFKPQIMADIWKSLRAARIVIAELSGKNINVFYEIGLAHSLGKPVIIITRNQEDVPFDLKALRYLYYDTNNPFWGQNLQKALIDMINKLLKEKDFGTVFEGIKVSGEIKYEEPTKKEAAISKEEKPLYDLTGPWQGEMKVHKTSYNINLNLVQEKFDLSGTIVACYTSRQKGKAKEEISVVQEIVRGEVKDDKATIYGVSFTFLRQGASSGYNLDTFFAKISSDGIEMTGNCTDTKQHEGTFSFKRKKAES